MSNYNFLIRNKGGQVSDALTWVVATMIIIFVLISAIYISSLLGKTKVVDKTKIGISGDDSTDWILEKSKIAYSIDNSHRSEIESWIGGSLENG